MAGLIAMFRRIEVAEEYARELRAKYDSLAEDHCRRELSAMDRRHRYRGYLRDVLKALPWISAD
jgi:hypothetical protein